MKEKLLFIINPVSGIRLGMLFLQKIQEILYERYDVFIMMTGKRGDAEKWAREYGEKFDVIVACGGDGTFNEIIAGNEKGADRVIGYVPAGSTNDFANSIGLKSDILEAAKAIVTGKPHTIDAGFFGDRLFTYVASFGAFTKASYSTSQEAKNILGHLAYLFEGGMELGSIAPEHVRINVGGEIHEDDYLFGAVSNSTSLGGVLSLSKDLVDMNDGMFEVMLIKNPQSPEDLSRIVYAVTTQNFDDCGLIEFFSCRNLTVEKGPKGGWSLDGEYEKGKDDVEIKNLHSAIKIIC